MKNLQGCEVKVAIAVAEPYVFAKLVRNLTYEYDGIDIRLIETLAKTLNFKLTYYFTKDPGYLYENGTAKGPFKSLFDNLAELTICGYRLQNVRLKFFDASASYISDSVVFVIPPGSDLTSFEQLIYPFELSLWISIVICFSIGIFVILIFKIKLKSYKKFMFGSNVTFPIFNMMEVCFTGQQNILPRRNFARYLLMMFMIYSLVMRTLYQGSYFKLLRSNPKHKEVQSIEDMIERDFRFYSIPAYIDVTRASKVIDKR
jgi:hypothetical protein